MCFFRFQNACGKSEQMVDWMCCNRNWIFSFNWGFSNWIWILLKETSFKKLIWLIFFSMKFMFLAIGLVGNSNVIFLPKCQVVIPSLDMWRRNKDLMNGVPKITSFLRFFTRRKFVSILRPWFSMIAVDSL